MTTVIALLLAATGTLGMNTADPLWIPFMMALGLCVFLVTMVNTNVAIVLLIASMLLSPEISAGAVPSRQVVLRFDDFLVAAVLFSWLAKTALRQELGLLRWTSLHGPLFLLTIWFVAATAMGIANGEVQSPKESFFYLLKYFEYFVIFFLGVNIIRDRHQVNLFWWALIVTACIVGACGWWQKIAGGVYRTTAPFEGEGGEPNTLAGYLVLIMGALVGRATTASSTKQFCFFMGIAAFLFVPFLNTLSRGGYMAFLAMYALLVMFAPQRRAWLILPLVIVAIVGPTLFPETVHERVTSTFVGATPYGSPGQQLGLDPSAAQRVDIWFWTFEQLKKHPFVGYGIMGLGLIDHQYCRVLGELGLIGAGLYLWVRWVTFRIVWRHYRQMTDPVYKGLILGYLCGYVGLLVQSFAGNIFIIVRIMEPYWFLTAMVMVLPYVVADSAEEPAASPAPAVS